MASRYYARFKQRKAGRSGGVVRPGNPGEAPADKAIAEKTATWPSAGPVGPVPFNRTTRFPVVKTTAKKVGLC